MHTITRRHWFAVALIASAAGNAFAQAYPTKAITVVVPYAVGGTTDIVARLVTQQIGNGLGQSLVVDNRAGGGGNIGWGSVARSAPDGHTILTTEMSFTIAPALGVKQPFDAKKDFAHVITAASAPHVLVVTPSLPAKTVQEFIALAKAQPGKLNYGSYGVGTSSHIQGSLLNLQAGLDLAHVPYKGAAPLLQDLRGGQLSSAFIDMATARPQLDAMKPLAVTGTKRNPLLPNVPTFAELGYHSFEPLGWFALFMPAGVPAPIARKFADEANRILRLPDVVQRIESLGMTPGGMPTAEFAKVVREDAAIYARIIREANIRLE